MADDVTPQIRSVVINTTDEERLAAFWAELLGVEVAHRTGGFLWLRPQRPGAFSSFKRVETPTEGRGVSYRSSAAIWMAATNRIVEMEVPTSRITRFQDSPAGDGRTRRHEFARSRALKGSTPSWRRSRGKNNSPRSSH